MKTVQIFTDGSSLGNPGRGGWCAILRYGSNEKILSGNLQLATNNQMELRAAIEALKALKEPCKIELFSDSSYVVKGINEWLTNWQKKAFKNVKNSDMWQEYIEASKNHKIRAIWVEGHSGHTENEKCDEIARMRASELKEI